MAKKPTTATIAPAEEKRGRSLNLVLQVGLITLPIKLHTGARAETVAFKSIHDACQSPVSMLDGSPGTRYCKTCAEYVAPDNVVKGFETEGGGYIVLTKEEIEAQRPDTEKVVEVDQFVDAGEIDPIYFQSSHYIKPGDGGARAFVLVRDALIKTGKVAIGKATIDKNEHTVVIRPFRGGLALHQLFHETELNQVHATDGEASDAELNLAAQLIKSMSGSFDPASYHDRYLANIKELIASKRAGKAAPTVVRQKRPVAVDLLSALSASVQAAKSKKKAA